MMEETTLLNVSSIINETLYPNPTINTINYSFDNDLQVASNVIIYNTTGQIMIREAKTITRGYNDFTFVVTSLPVGTYFIKIQEMNLETRFIKL